MTNRDDSSWRNLNRAQKAAELLTIGLVAVSSVGLLAAATMVAWRLVH